MAYSSGGGEASDIPDSFWQILGGITQAKNVPKKPAKPTQTMQQTSGSTVKSQTMNKSTAKSVNSPASSGGSSGGSGSSGGQQQQYTTQTKTVTTPGSNPYTKLDPAVEAFLKETGAVMPGWFKNNVYKTGPSTKTVTERVPIQNATIAPAPSGSVSQPVYRTAAGVSTERPNPATSHALEAMNDQSAWAPPPPTGNYSTSSYGAGFGSAPASANATPADPNWTYKNPQDIASGYGYPSPFPMNPEYDTYHNALQGVVNPASRSVWDWLLGPAGQYGVWG